MTGESTRRKPLPRKIAVRLSDLPRHFRALSSNLEAIGFNEYRSGMTGGGKDELTKLVYPIERPFEIVDNYIVELAALALGEMGLPAGDAPSNLRQLETEGVISRALRSRLADIHRIRNDAQHDYPDARAKVIYAAATELTTAAPNFLRAYGRWLRTKGYGKEG